MEAWLAELWQIVDRVTGDPEGLRQVLLARAGAFVAMVCAFQYVGLALGIKDVGFMRVFVALVLGIVVLVGGAATSSVYLMPVIGRGPIGGAVALVAPIALAAAVAVPLQCVIRKSHYFQTFAAFASSVLAALLAAVAINAILGSVMAGTRKSDEIRFRRGQVDRFYGS